MAVNTILSTKITDTGVEPITVEQAKLHAAIDYPDYDSILPIYISAARIAIEKATGLALVEKTIKQTVSVYQGFPYRLRFSPVKQFNYALLVDQNNCGQTVLASPASPVNLGANNDVLYINESGIYEIEYKAGFDTVSADLKLAILQMFAFIFNHRGDYSEGRLDISAEAERIIIDTQRFVI